MRETEKAAHYPDSNSVTGRVLGALLRGERLTVRDCWLRFGSSTLTQHVQRLREYGWPILTEPATVRTSDAGRSATIGIYSLAADAIAAAGEAGREFAAAALIAERERKLA